MKCTVEFDCKNCLNSITVDAVFKAPGTVGGFMRDKVIAQGWHLFRTCLCPDCIKKALQEKATCKYCKHWYNKSLSSPECSLDDVRCIALDSCEHFEEGWK